jgi:hypothetical protein
LAFSDEVERIRYAEMISDVLISNFVFFNMMHVDAKDVANRRVIERGDMSAELGSEGPRFSAVKRCIGRAESTTNQVPRAKKPDATCFV